MAYVGQPFTSGRWMVKAGREEEFIKRWTTFANWISEGSPGEDFWLLQGQNEPLLFISFGAWKDLDELKARRSDPKFAELLGKCRELCDDFQASDLVLKAGSVVN